MKLNTFILKTETPDRLSSSVSIITISVVLWSFSNRELKGSPVKPAVHDPIKSCQAPD